MYVKAWPRSRANAPLTSAEPRTDYNFRHASLQTTAPPHPLRAGVVCFVFGRGHGVFLGGTQGHRTGVYQRRHGQTGGGRRHGQCRTQPCTDGLRLVYACGFAACALFGVMGSTIASLPCPAACCSGTYCVGYRAATALSRTSRTLSISIFPA